MSGVRRHQRLGWGIAGFSGPTVVSHPHLFACELTWTGASEGPIRSYETYSRAYRVDFEGKPPLEGSSSPAFRGDGARHNPEDLLVAALSSCHCLSYLALCARRGVRVVAYSDSARGRMEAVGGVIRFTEVVLRPIVTVLEGTDDALAGALHDEAHASCFIASSVNFPVTHDATLLFPRGS